MPHVADKNEVKFFIPINKVDKDKRMVYGYASTEAVDSQGEIVKLEAIKKALPDYLKFGNIREMHQPSAVGKAKEATIDEKGLYLGAKIVDNSAWEKVKEGVYNGFSIGGRKVMQKGKEILGLVLTEISIVDRPANPESVFDVFKAEYKGEKSHDEVRMKIWQALNGNSQDMMGDWGVMEVFDDYCVAVNYHENTFWSYPYTADDDGNVTLGDPAEVKLTWTEKGEVKNSFEKILGYTPWYIDYYLPVKKHTSMAKPEEVKKNDEGEKTEVPPVVEPEKNEDGTPKVPETPVEEKKPETETPPATPPGTDTPPASPAEATPAEDVAKVGAKFSKNTLASIKSVIKSLSDLVAESEKEEKADTETTIEKTDLGSLSEMLEKFDARFSKVEETLAKVATLEERMSKIETSKAPVKVEAGFVQKKGEEHISEEEKKSSLTKIAELKEKLVDLAKKKDAMPASEYARLYGKEANDTVVELRKLSASVQGGVV